MKKPIKYSGEPINKLTVVEDFLPAHTALGFREKSINVKPALNQHSKVGSVSQLQN